ncbi:hypothetical protein EAF04_004071 [Stromatinia cepivora]|nr:hypothetical protein EAF04_004071 [Stromatinia cepivora]
MLSQIASHRYNPPHPIGNGSACTMQNSVNESREEDLMNPPQEPETVQQGIDQITTTFLSPEFDDLWTSSFPMNDFAMFDDMWNASQIFTIPDVNINSTTTR